MLRIASFFLSMLLLTAGPAVAAPLTAACNPVWPPMELQDENKNIIGYDFDVLTAIGKEIGMDVKFRNVAWDGIFAALESGQADVIASCVTITDKRKKAYLFSDPYYEVRQAVVVAKDASITKPEDLKGKRVGMQIGTTAVEAMNKLGVEMDKRTYDDVGLVFEDMRAGRLDAVVCDDPVARYYAARKAGYANTMKVAFVTEDTETIGFVFAKNNEALRDKVNQGLAAIRKNGVEKEIRVKWLGE